MVLDFFSFVGNGEKRAIHWWQTYKAPKVPNEIKREAATAKKKGPTITPVTQTDDNGVRSKLCYLNCNSYKIEICWAIALTRLLQVIYNITQEYIAGRLRFDHDDLVVHLKMKKTRGKRPGSMKLKNLKDAINHIAVKGLLKKRESKSKAGSDIGHHTKWNFSMEKCPSKDFIKSKVDISPVAIAFDITHNFQFIGNSIYNVSGVDMEDGDAGGHVVLIVGYGYTKENKLFFLIQNSWGEDWGVKGFGRIFIDDESKTTLVYPDGPV
ncbi:Cysteine proteinases superfamily protein [Arabidopsis thaliana]|uniref:Cysteine proteinases superfamily protein n=1 Tax=Arabidopsis thaliana TaxID=3702 RepID=A0A1P8ASQ4_ARATH|nr:Cysteine proteinases superfamily protein [Arabidopsis thaliana]ANM59694.1 Cysteine proteinases superfamily protein [Arabidopsis thaliana]|eukprot:NP_001322034.1 Cysteine proteinases superfamily protein [Arabidopsis thaliana]